MNEKRVVVDASVAIKWIVSEQGTDAALGMLDSWVKDDVRITAPCLMFVEASNALYKRVRREGTDHCRGRRFTGMPDGLGY